MIAQASGAENGVALAPLAAPLRVQLSDLRSSVVTAACDALCAVAVRVRTRERLQDEREVLAEANLGPVRTARLREALCP